MAKPKRIKTLQELGTAAEERRAVTLGSRGRRVPAAVIMNYQARYVLQLLDAGIYLYHGARRVDLSKPPRKWVPSKLFSPPPILNLPYYPDA